MAEVKPMSIEEVYEINQHLKHYAPEVRNLITRLLLERAHLVSDEHPSERRGGVRQGRTRSAWHHALRSGSGRHQGEPENAR
jgi:hypothetical protein